MYVVCVYICRKRKAIDSLFNTNLNNEFGILGTRLVVLSWLPWNLDLNITLYEIFNKFTYADPFTHEKFYLILPYNSSKVQLYHMRYNWMKEETQLNSTSFSYEKFLLNVILIIKYDESRVVEWWMVCYHREKMLQ